MGHMDPSDDTEARIAALATRQHGVLDRRQLRRAGLSDTQIRRWIEQRRLHRLHTGVFAVGHEALTLNAHRLAAVLATRVGTVLSHRSAAAVWGFRPSETTIEITLPTTAGCRGPLGVRVHRTRDPIEATRIGALPVTDAARTQLDLAAVVGPHYVEASLAQADLLGHFDLRGLRAVIVAHPRHPGARSLAAVLDGGERDELALTFSELEIRMRELCAQHGLPPPLSNHPILGARRDFAWPAEDLVVETDGWSAHRGRRAFEADRARDRQLTVAGYRVVRFTHRQVVDDPGAVAAAIRALLAPTTGRAR